MNSKDRAAKKARQDKAKRNYKARNPSGPSSKPKGSNKAQNKLNAQNRAKEMAKNRIKNNQTIKQVKQKNQQSMRDKAADRHKKFKQTGVQTHGGTKKKFNKTEQTKIKKAGYNVKDYSTTKFKTDTQLQAAKDKAKYGNTVPKGSFNITKTQSPATDKVSNFQTDGQLVASSLSGGTGGGHYHETRSGAFVGTQQAESMLANPQKFRMSPADVRYLRESMGLPRAQTPSGIEVGQFAANDLSGMQISSPRTLTPTRTYGYPSQQEVDAAAEEGSSGFTPSASLNINKQAGESANPLSRALQIKALGALDALTGNLGDFDKQGGQTEFGRQLGDSINAAKTIRNDLGELTGQSSGPIDTAKNIAKFATDNRNDLMKLAQSKDVSLQDIADSTTYAKNIKNLGPLQATANLSPDQTQGIGDTYNFAKGTDLYKDTLTDFGGPKFPNAVDQFANYLGENYNKLTDDVANNRRVVSDMLIGNDPRLDTAKAIAYQYQDKVNPNLRDLGIEGFKTAVNAAMQDNAPQLAGVNKNERGITGSVGNYLLSNLGRNIVTDNLPGTNNALDLASNIISSGSDPTSSTYRPSQRFLATAGIGGPTPETILKGITRFNRGGGGGNRFGGANQQPTPATLAPQEILEYLEQQAPEFNTELGLPEFVDPTDAYDNALNEYLYDPNYFPQVQQYTPPARTSFKQTFNRNYF